MNQVEFLNNKMVINQIAQVNPTTGLSNPSIPGMVPVQIKYYLSAYSPDLDFIPVKTDSLDKVGFFEVSPSQRINDNAVIYATKWNEKQPIIYAISANTPEKVKPAIRDGILYWNKILGENKVQVIELTDKSITAPMFATTLFNGLNGTKLVLLMLMRKWIPALVRFFMPKFL